MTKVAKCDDTLYYIRIKYFLQIYINNYITARQYSHSDYSTYYDGLAETNGKKFSVRSILIK